ncbi:MAG: TolC family protein [Proteobacteria bacterium]|nr:TolC family protein [Pseudomonadota bacterium]
MTAPHARAPGLRSSWRVWRRRRPRRGRRPASPSPAQPSSSSAASTPVPAEAVLPLDSALQIAVKGNRSLENSRLEVVKETKNAKAFRANQLPVVQLEAKASELLTPVGVNFNQGAFGIYPGIGPIPANNVQITTTPKLTTYFVVALRQPVAQLPRIGLAARVKEINVALAAEEVRAQRDSLRTDVKRAYYAILQTEASLEAALDNLRFQQELNRTIADKYQQKTVLRTDLLEAQRRLADAEFDVQQQRDALATNKSQLNLLLARDIHTPFEVQQVGESPITQRTLPELEKLALAQRPQLHQAALKVRQAELDRRITAAQYAPDLDLAVTYLQPANMALAPGSYITVGAEMKWIPITWGKVDNEIQAKTQAVLQARNNEKQLSDQVLVEVGSLYRTVHTDLERVRAAKMSLEAAREALRVARVRYGQKAVLLQDVYDAVTRVASATRGYLDAVLALDIAQAELEQAIGEDE